MASQGPNFPDTGVSGADFTSLNPGWSNADRVVASDDSYATVILDPKGFPGGLFSDWLDVTDFDFTIPTGATPTSILVEIELKYSTSGTDVGYIAEVDLIVAGAHFGIPITADTNITTSDVFYSKTFSSGLPTAAQINAADFGACVAVGDPGNDPGKATLTVSCDSMRITITYLVSGGKEQIVVID